MTSLVLGLMTVAAGVLGFLHWPPGVLIFFKLWLPVSFILGGGVAVIAGISSLKR